jgi:hypothetical protein
MRLTRPGASSRRIGSAASRVPANHLKVHTDVHPLREILLSRSQFAHLSLFDTQFVYLQFARLSLFDTRLIGLRILHFTCFFIFFFPLFSFAAPAHMNKTMLLFVLSSSPSSSLMAMSRQCPGLATASSTANQACSRVQALMSSDSPSTCWAAQNGLKCIARGPIVNGPRNKSDVQFPHRPDTVFLPWSICPRSVTTGVLVYSPLNFRPITSKRILLFKNIK